ncbi:MAG TPA: 50S ribosomal protein L4 [Phycisphaerales bacterium]|nr:50S ribosomal protein L4 [Phycisphaerales bacterium]
MEIPVLNMQGKQVGTLNVDEQALGGEVNAALIKQAYVRYHANRRQGSARTKNRAKVEGSTRKLYKQKHTGNARAGAARTNTRRGGGRAFGKFKPREDFRLDMPIKMRRKANRNALLAKLIDNEVKIIDGFSMKEPKTHEFQALLGSFGVNGSCLVAINRENTNIRLSARNCDRVAVCDAAQLTCFEMLNSRFLVISKADLEAWLTGPSSVTNKAAKQDRKEAA